MALPEDRISARKAAFVYRYPCLDGAYACLCISKYLNITQPYCTQRFEPCKKITSSDLDFSGETVVFFLDIMPPDALTRALHQVPLVVVIDHHLSNANLLNEITSEQPTNLVVDVDMDRSAARIAYDRYETVIKDSNLSTLIEYVQDADLWRWSLELSAQINCYMQTNYVKADFEAFPNLLDNFRV